MKDSIAVFFISTLCFLPACDLARIIRSPNTTAVSLVNNGDFDVEVDLYISDEQNIPEDVLTLGDKLEFTLSPGETEVFTRNCDDLQAIIIANADLVLIGSIGPGAGTGVLRDGDDFGCGDRIFFTFDHSDAIVDFEVTSTTGE